MNIVYRFVIDLEEKYRDMIASFSNDSIHDYRVLVRKNQEFFNYLKEEYDNENFKLYFDFHKSIFETLSGARDLKVGMEILSERYGVELTNDIKKKILSKIDLALERVKHKEPAIDILNDLESMDINEHDLVSFLFVKLSVYHDRLKRQSNISEKNLTDYHEERKTIKKIRYIISHINMITNVEIVSLKSYKAYQDVYGLLNDLDNIRFNFIEEKTIPLGIIDSDIRKLTTEIDTLKVVSKIKKDIQKIKVKKSNFYKNYNYCESKISIVTGKAVILDDMNRILFIKRSKKYKGVDNLWELPGGRIDKGEKIYSGLKREVLEESGLDIKSLEVGMIWELFREGKPDILGLTFICRAASSSIILSEEHCDYKWVEIKDLETFPIINELKEDFYNKGLLGQVMRYII
ncbi:MAG: NUDIX domain-containing protein [Firmicutes bacterium]|jgi:8-oxo-dGTP diphosphatase|nr:NUDIX domain-containing protein [Bacillota bacterium]